MRATKNAAGTLALGLTLTALSTVAGPSWGAQASPASAAADKPLGNRVGNPVGGRQLSAAGVIVNRQPGVPPPPAMPGASFLLADLDSGRILVARAPHAPHPPASTLKALVALTLIPVLGTNTKILVKPEDVRVEGSHLGILPGTTYRVGTLLQGMLTTSGNDAAYALARGNHSMAATLAAMNQTAAHLGAFDTVAKDPSGLDRAGQKSSSYDLALIGRAAMKLPAFRRYVLVKTASLPGGRSALGKRTPGFRIGSHNKLLYNYRGAIGIKTGYTVAAKFTFIGAATRGGRTYLVTEMASPSQSWRPAAALLDWAFAHGGSLTPIGQLVEPEAATGSKPPAAKPPASQPPASQPPASQPFAPKPRAAGHLLSPPDGSPHESAGQPALPVLIGAAAGIGVLALVATWAARRISRRRR